MFLRYGRFQVIQKNLNKLVGWAAFKKAVDDPGFRDIMKKQGRPVKPFSSKDMKKASEECYTLAQKYIPFMKEAVPLFLLAAFLVFVFDYVGGLRLLENAVRPLMNGLLGLPESAVRVFMKTIIRREAGAVELNLIGADFSNLQLVVALLTMTLLIPCVNTVVVLFKERGARVAGATLAGVFVYAVLAGGLVNHVCRALGITFG